MADIGRVTSVDIRTRQGQGPKWEEVDKALDQLGGNKGGKHLRSTGAGNTLYVSETGRHRPFAGKDRAMKYGHAVALIKQSIDNTFGPGSGDKVFQNLGINKNKEGFKLSDVGRLRAEVAKLDAELFRYDQLDLTNPNAVRNFTKGQCVELVRIPNFHMFETHDKGDFHGTGGKVHVSIHPQDVPRAWDVIMPILLEHRDTIKQFKITDMEGVAGKLQGGNLDQAQRDEARRILDGAQITIYQHAPEGGDGDHHDFAQIMREVTTALEQAGIRPGEQPESDLPVSEYVSFRHDKDNLRDGGGGGEMRPEDPNYGVHKQHMAESDLYRELLDA